MGDDAKLKHLEMIQGVINRMSVNSFLLRGWSVVLVAAIFALAAARESATIILAALLPVLAFWGLDGYYLHQERLFRSLYNKVMELPEENVDLSMDTTKLHDRWNSWPSAAFSKTVVVFHGTVAGAILLVYLVAFRGR